MAKTRKQKEEELKALNEKLNASKSAAFFQYFGLKVSELEELRRALKKEESELVVAKKSLFKLMLVNAGYPKEHVDAMEGGVAVAFGYRDEVAPFRIVENFAKEHAAAQFFGGIIEGNFVSSAYAQELAKLPSRGELLAQLCCSFNAPISGIVHVLAGTLKSFVSVLHQLQKQKA